MGKDLFDSCPEAAAVFESAGEDIKKWCFEGTKEELTQTHVTQPAVFTVSMAAYAAFKAALAADAADAADAAETAANLESSALGQTAPPAAAKSAADANSSFEIIAAAGFSLGEYSALTAAGCIRDFRTALALIRKRGEFMAEAGRDAEGNQTGGMAAVVGERGAVLNCIEELREDNILEAVNFNSPEQTVAAGDKEALARLRKRAKEFGLRAIPLSVSAAFHSSMMRPAAERLKETLETIDFHAPEVTVYTNVTGKPLMDGKPETEADAAWIRSSLALQVMSPVYWQETIENMVNNGVELFIETGPGQTLSGLMKKIAPDAAILNIGTAEGIEEALAYVRTCTGNSGISAV